MGGHITSTRLKTWIFNLVLIWALGVVSSASAATLETRDVRDWKMSAYTSDETGEFSHCAIYAQYRNGVLLLVSVDRNSDYTLGFSADMFSFDAGGEIPVDVSIDGRTAGRSAYVITSDHVSVFIEKGSRTINRLKRGRRITARIGGETYLFDLDNSAYALEQAEECVGYHLRRGSRTEPTQGSQETTPTDAPRNAEGGDHLAVRLEATVLSANLLGKLSFDGWTLLAPHAKPDFAERYDAFWESPEAIGGVMIFSPDTERVTAAALRKDIVSGDASSCEGNFTSAQTGTSAPGIHFVVSCTAVDRPWSSFYSIVEHPNGGLAVFATASIAEDLSTVSKLGLETATLAQQVASGIGSPATGE